MNSPVRRIVTGHDQTGRAIVLSAGTPPVVIHSPVQPGLAFYELWNTQTMPSAIGAVPGDEPTLHHEGVAPPRHGTVIRIVDMPPEGPDGPAFDAEQSRELFSSVGLADNADHHRPGRHPLMHRTESIDYGIVLEGEVVLVLDDSEVALKPGDVVIQRGTIHAWTNRTEANARMVFILTDGTFEPDLAQLLEPHAQPSAGK